MSKKYIDLTGQKFNRLTVLSKNENIIQGKDKRSLTAWICLCDCGTTKIIKTNNLIRKNGNIKSCGCLIKENNNFTQSQRKYEPQISSARKVWQNYKRDKYCLEFEDFYSMSQMNCEYCGIEPYRKYNLSNTIGGNFIYNGLDRVDNNLGHTKENCVACCKICNIAKRNRTLEEFKDHIKILKTAYDFNFEIVHKQMYSSKHYISSVKRVHKIYNDANEIELELFYSMSQMNCFYCGCEPSNNSNRYKSYKSSAIALLEGSFDYNGLDRIDSNKKHTLDNVVPCCKFCNIAKSDLTFNQFQNWIKRIKEFNGF